MPNFIYVTQSQTFSAQPVDDVLLQKILELIKNSVAEPVPFESMTITISRRPESALATITHDDTSDLIERIHVIMDRLFLAVQLRPHREHIAVISVVQLLSLPDYVKVFSQRRLCSYCSQPLRDLFQPLRRFCYASVCAGHDLLFTTGQDQRLYNSVHSVLALDPKNVSTSFECSAVDFSGNGLQFEQVIEGGYPEVQFNVEPLLGEQLTRPAVATFQQYQQFSVLVVDIEPVVEQMSIPVILDLKMRAEVGGAEIAFQEAQDED